MNAIKSCNQTKKTVFKCSSKSKVENRQNLNDKKKFATTAKCNEVYSLHSAKFSASNSHNRHTCTSNSRRSNSSRSAAVAKEHTHCIGITWRSVTCTPSYKFNRYVVVVPDSRFVSCDRRVATCSSRLQPTRLRFNEIGKSANCSGNLQVNGKCEKRVKSATKKY